MTVTPANRVVIETPLRVRYSETDAMGVVYHTNYIVWFEVGRGEYSRAVGADYRLWEQAGLFLPVTEVSCRYHAPAHYGDMVVVSTWVDEIRSRMVAFGYEVRMQETGKVLASGRTVHVCVGREGQIAHIPDDWRRLMSEGT